MVFGKMSDFCSRPMQWEDAMLMPSENLCHSVPRKMALHLGQRDDVYHNSINNIIVNWSYYLSKRRKYHNYSIQWKRLHRFNIEDPWWSWSRLFNRTNYIPSGEKLWQNRHQKQVHHTFGLCEQTFHTYWKRQGRRTKQRRSK